MGAPEAAQESLKLLHAQIAKGHDPNADGNATLPTLCAGPKSRSHTVLYRSHACADEAGGQSGQEANVLQNLISIAAQAVSSQAPTAGATSTTYRPLDVCRAPGKQRLLMPLTHVVTGTSYRGTAAD